MAWQLGPLSPFYFYNQNNSPTWDASTDEDHTLNCGPTALSMVIKHLREVYIPSDTIHDVIEGEGTIGGTTEQQLGSFLQKYCNISTSFYYPGQVSNSDNTGLVNLEYKYLYEKKPLIALGGLYVGGQYYNHWRVIVGMSDQTVTCADPWYGSSFTWTSYQDHWNNFKGVLIGIEESRGSVV